MTKVREQPRQGWNPCLGMRSDTILLKASSRLLLKRSLEREKIETETEGEQTGLSLVNTDTQYPLEDTAAPPNPLAVNRPEGSCCRAAEDVHKQREGSKLSTGKVRTINTELSGTVQGQKHRCADIVPTGNYRDCPSVVTFFRTVPRSHVADQLQRSLSLLQP